MNEHNIPQAPETNDEDNRQHEDSPNGEPWFYPFDQGEEAE